jgi:tetratricopeptide (TPR) repeat protein
MQQAASLQPRDPHIQHDLGLTCLEGGQPALAIGAFKQAVALRPGFSEAWWRLGVAFEMSGDAEQAIQSLSRAVELKPDLHDAAFRLGRLLEGQGRQTMALSRYDALLTLLPPCEMRDMVQARALLIQKRDAELVALLTAATHTYPKSTAVSALLGFVLTEAGDFAGAEKALSHALRLNPGAVELYYDLVRCRRITAADSALVHNMRFAATRPRPDGQAAIKLQLALGKACDDLGDYASAMAAYDAADAVRRRFILFDPMEFDQRIDRIIARSTGLAFPAMGVTANRRAVFVVGMPRSGTTLCEQILSSHPLIAGAGELHFWERRARIVESSAPGGAGGAAEMGQAYLDYLAGLEPDAARVIDKMPTNFLCLDLIAAALPGAVIVHCRRSPLDTALSIHQTFFSEQRDFPTGGSDLVDYYRGYERLMQHWRKVLPPERFVEVDYEALVANPRPVVEGMLELIGVEWDDRCLSPQNNDRAVRTASKWQARQPIYQTAVAKWRNYLPYLGPLAALVPTED